MPEHAPGIRGWLAFFSIGVLATPFVLFYYSIQSWLEASREFEKEIGHPLDFRMVYLLSQRVADDWNAALFFGAIAAFVATIGASIWLIWQWWRRQRQFPRNWIIFQVCLLAITVISLVYDPKAAQPRDVAVSVIHILFWWRSKQVALTFTQ